MIKQVTAIANCEALDFDRLLEILNRQGTNIPIGTKRWIRRKGCRNACRIWDGYQWLIGKYYKDKPFVFVTKPEKIPFL